MKEPKTIATRLVTQDGALPGRRLRSFVLQIRGPKTSTRVEVDQTSFRVGSQKACDLQIRDPKVSRMHLEVVADEIGYRCRDLGSTNGTVVDGYRAVDVYLRPGSIIGIGDHELRFELSDTEVEVPASQDSRFGPLIGGSVAMRELYAILAKASPTDVTMLIEGESGTGKELVAAAIHRASSRAGGPFVVFDCAAVPPNLLESELFGHERGAFTGATQARSGRMEEAHGGTLFLDELGELPLDLQPKLLRALETREIRRLGSQKMRKVDVRLVAATNRDLSDEVNRGAFRADLYYRLAVIRLQVPPLRERTEDIGLLVPHFIHTELADEPSRASRFVESISGHSLARMKTYPWPGNVRELRNLIRRTIALSSPDETPDWKPATLPGNTDQSSETQSETNDAQGHDANLVVDLSRPFSELKQEVVTSFTRNYLTRQLAAHDGNFSRAAASSGLDRMYFKRMLKKVTR